MMERVHQVLIFLAVGALSSWFGNLFGFEEVEYFKTQNSFTVKNTTINSHFSKEHFIVGTFDRPTLAQLEDEGSKLLTKQEETTYESFATDGVLELHSLHPGAMFQAASQLNALEFYGPSITPEYGVTRYIDDHTQGPQCALATAAAVVYRNYLVPIQGQVGQVHNRQFDNLDLFEKSLPKKDLFYVKNGYTFSDDKNLTKLTASLKAMTPAETRNLTRQIRISLQAGAQVIFNGSNNHGGLTRLVPKDGKPVLVNQAFCSALSCAYTDTNITNWETFATLVLDAQYEGTLWAASTKYREGLGTNKVFLTLLGGGVFGNPPEWIASSMARAIAKFIKNQAGLQIKVMYYKTVDEDFAAMLKKMVDEELKHPLN